MTHYDKIILVSNRLPVHIEPTGDESWEVLPASGGLVTALSPLMKRRHGTWIGWAGCADHVPADRLLADFSRDHDYEVRAVPLREAQIQKYYRGFSNQSIWPLFHDMLGYASFDTANWEQYVDVNSVFAETVREQLWGNSFVWIHDYQLLLVGRALRDRGVDQTLNFFLHIPFPSRDLFARMPWKVDLLEAMLAYDHIGFQTQKDLANFIQCVKVFVPEVTVRGRAGRGIARFGGREVRLGEYPISIDFDEFNQGATQPGAAEAAWYIRENMKAPFLMLGLDRLDYTKGIPDRFLALERALEKYPDLQEKISLVQVVVPSRLNVPEYAGLKEELDALAGRINGRFSRHGWLPIYYVFNSLDRTQLLGHYRACDVALITPLRDGMNLVAKEYVASSVDGQGVLILSEFAGAAQQLHRGGLLVNPYDREATADAIYQAYTMEPEEKRRRMRRLRAEVRRNNVHKWVGRFLSEQVSEAATTSVS